jgi:hypothetical protein
MSLVSVFLTTVTRSLRLGSQPTALDPLNKHVEVRHSNVATLQDPRFTKEQLDKMAKAANAKHLLKS